MKRQKQNTNIVIDELGEACKNQFRAFLEQYVNDVNEDDNMNPEPQYLEYSQLMAENEQSTMEINFQHISEFDSQLADTIAINYYRCEPYQQEALCKQMQDQYPESSILNDVPRPYYVSIYNYPLVFSIRDLKTTRVGYLIAVQGTITRTTQARPEQLLANFRCLECNTKIQNIPQQFKYTQPTICPTEHCGNKTTFLVQPEESEFNDWQQIRMQENSSDIPAGSMPRTISVIQRNDLVELAKPGDKVIVTGTLVVVPDVFSTVKGGVTSIQERGRMDHGNGVMGLHELGVRDLCYRLCVVASHVQRCDQENTQDGEQRYTVEQQNWILEQSQDTQGVTKQIRSISPHIFGHESIKKGILQMQQGGIPKTTKDGQHLRGDINVCIVGDPSTAKSQFLQWVCKFHPHAVYTSGKASSAAGLTASVVRDIESGEYTIEAGALMLADNGICCIDEFDKMEGKDQSVIHEAMEQQTISIAKAGIQATQNARTSIQAAANPVSGRYDRTRTLKQNINISPPIMSRFDQFFVVLDECNETNDRNIANHQIEQHQQRSLKFLTGQKTEFCTLVDGSKEIDTNNINDIKYTNIYSIEQLRTFIRFSRSLCPVFTQESRNSIVEEYENQRMNDSFGATRSTYRVTVRQQESQIRLSEAIARLNMQEEITVSHVQEASAQQRQSIVTVISHEIPLQNQQITNKNSTIIVDENMYSTDDTATNDIENDNTTTNENIIKRPRKDIEDITISYMEYQRLTTMIILYIQERETQKEKLPTKYEQQQWLVEQETQACTTPTIVDLKRIKRIGSLVLQRLIDNDKVQLNVGEIVALNPSYELINSDAIKTKESLRLAKISVEETLDRLHNEVEGGGEETFTITHDDNMTDISIEVDDQSTIVTSQGNIDV